MLCFILSFGFLFRFSSMYIVTVKPTRVCCIFSSCACCCCLFCLMLCLVFLTNTPAAEWKYIFECFNIKYYFFHSFCPFLCLLVLSEWGFFFLLLGVVYIWKQTKYWTRKKISALAVLCYFFGKSRCIFFSNRNFSLDWFCACTENSHFERVFLFFFLLCCMCHKMHRTISSCSTTKLLLRELFCNKYNFYSICKVKALFHIVFWIEVRRFSLEAQIQANKLILQSTVKNLESEWTVCLRFDHVKYIDDIKSISTVLPHK